MTCEQLDAFFDGELPAGEADAFRRHLPTCERCQAVLRGRMMEAMVVDEVAPAPATDMLAQRRSRTRIAAATAVAAAAAAAVLIVWWPRGQPEPAQEVALEVSIARGSAVMRGQAAHVGDVVHATARGSLAHRAIWIYRGDTALMVACPGASCSDPTAELALQTLGTYSIVVLGSRAEIPAPHGSLDTDVAAAAQAGATYKIDSLDVQ